MMKRHVLHLSVLLILQFCFLAFNQPACAQFRKLTSLVDPFIGTDGFGHTFPGATTPFGMVQLSPDTRTSGWENCSGYHSSNPTIIGFSHTHLSGTGASDYGDIMFMATEGIQLSPGSEENPRSGYRSAFRKETERAKPGYYKVMLDDHGIQAEMTATTRCGLQKYTLPASDNAVIVLDLVHGISDQVTDAKIELKGKNAVSGYRRSKGWAKDHIVYFYAEFSADFREAGIADKNGQDLTGSSAQSPHGLKAWMKFKVRNYDSILIRTGISTVSEESAKENLYKEIPHWDFNKVMMDAAALWEDELSRIIVEGGTKSDRINFYTSLYHAMISPNIMSDHDGRYRGMDGKIHKMERGNMYTVFSLWDTFRALHPLYTIIDPQRAQEFVRALLQKYRESGLLPVWELASNETFCMIGYHAVPVIVDTYMKGLRDFDAGLALEAMKSSATREHLGLKHYMNRGYIPSDKENESVSKTLEYAYDDWCIAQMARELNMKEDYEYFLKRSSSWINVYDHATGFMRGKKNANFVEPFDHNEVSGIYTEANAWQYTWFVPHDIPGLIKTMGGKTSFTQRLDSLFEADMSLTGRSQPDISGLIGQYAHGNEPSHHMSYLYTYSDKPYRTHELNHRIMKEFYTNNRDGLIGNEDCGQMSAWFIFTSMGFYPVCPGSNRYELSTPLFSKVTIGKGNANRFTVTRDSMTASSIYPRSIKLNGTSTEPLITHESIARGGTLEFFTCSDPALTVNLTNIPASDAKPVATVPYIRSGEKAFLDSTSVEVFCPTPGAVIRMTFDGTEPNESSMVYKRPFQIKNSMELKLKAFHPEFESSYTETATFIRIPYRKTISYVITYSHLYTAGGRNGLIDGVYGDTNAFGGWQGFFGDDFEATIDLGQVRSFTIIESTFLQQYPSWIWLPEQVTYEVSTDGDNFHEVFSKTNVVPLDEPGSFIRGFKAEIGETSARYVKVKAKNIGKCPPWHPGAGENAWIFIDEIRIE
jgi:predicted alpha-1,2-mannosidase